MSFTESECEKWAMDPLKNPKTGRKITVGKGVYNKIKKEDKIDNKLCDHHRAS